MKNLKEKSSTSCGSCRYLERQKTFEVPCINNGKIVTSSGCNSHSPDVFSLVHTPQEKNNLNLLAPFIREMGPKQLLVLSELLKVERRTRKKGFYLMQKVYVRVRGRGNYFSNFVEAYVLMAEKDQILLVDENCAHHWYLDYNKKISQSLYTEEQFIDIRQEMYDKKMFQDPEIEKQKNKLESARIAKLLKLDEAEEQGLAPKKKKTRQDLFDLAQRISKGYIKKSKREDFNDLEEIKVSYE